MLWARMLTGTVDQELLLKDEYLAAENRILRAQCKGRLLLCDAEKATLAEIAQRLGRKALEELAAVAKPGTLLAWCRKRIAGKFDGSRFRQQAPLCCTLSRKNRGYRRSELRNSNERNTISPLEFACEV